MRKIFFCFGLFCLLLFVNSCAYDMMLKLSYDKNEIDIFVGDVVSVKPNIEFIGTISEYKINYSLSNSIATVDNDGKLIAVDEGTVVLTATANDIYNSYAILVINIRSDIKIELSYPTEFIDIYVGDKLSIKPNMSCNEEYNKSDFKLKYILSNDIASIDEEGNLFANEVGTTFVTATVDDKYNSYAVLLINIYEQIIESQPTDTQKVESALAACTLANNTTANITLPVIEGVAWSLKETYGNAVIENGVLKVTRPENGEGNVTVVVVATATFGAESDSKEIEVEIIEKEDSGIKEVTELDTEKTYKLGLYQGNKAAFLFATGNMSGFYGELVENAATAADVKVIAVEGGYQLLVGSKYLELAQEFNVEQNKTYTDVKFVEEATDFVWVHNTENNTFTHVFEDATYYIGTYGTYNTLSASKLDKIGISFPAHLYEVKAEQGGGNDQPEPPVIENGLLLTANKLFATVDPFKTSYNDHNGSHVVDGITYETTNVLRSSQTAFKEYIQCKAQAGIIKNTTAYSKELKTITFKFYNTYEQPNMPTLKAGATADSLTEVTGVLTGGTKTGVMNGGYEVLEFTITYTIPAGCYFWEYSDTTKGAKFFSQIVLEF